MIALRNVERPQCVLDALGLFAGLAPDGRLRAQDLHDRGHEPAVDRRQGHAGVVAVDQVELEKLEGVGHDPVRPKGGVPERGDDGLVADHALQAGLDALVEWDPAGASRVQGLHLALF